MLRKPQLWWALLIALVIVPGLVFGASQPKYQMESNRVPDLQRHIGGPEMDNQGSTAPVRFGRNVRVGARAAASPGTELGFTTYDYQHNGSTGRGACRIFGLL